MHIDDLLDRQPLTSHSAADLDALLLANKKSLDAIAALGIPIGELDPFLIRLTVRCLPSDLRVEWMASLGLSNEFPTYQQLHDMLKAKVRAWENSEIGAKITSTQAKSTTERPASPKSYAKPAATKQVKFVNSRSATSSAPSTTTGSASYVAFTPKEKTSEPGLCPLCKEKHFVLFCPSYRKASPQNRRMIVHHYRLCFNCLGRHRYADCRTKQKCRHCDQPHHTSTHVDADTPAKSVQEPAVPSQGSPTPRIKWHVPNITFEESIKSAADVIENKLTMRSLRREYLGFNFTCEASNTDLVPPKRKSVKLDLILKPLTIKVSRPGSANKNESLQAKHRYDLECETTGSNPPAVITWYKGKRPLKHVSEERSQNLTISRVEFVPNVEDNRKPVICRAENPNVKGLFLEQSWTLDVVYPPLVSLSLGSTLNAGDIKEGDDVYFECHINSNPPISKLIWIHNNEILMHNTSARIIQSNQSLVLQSVTRNSAGYYACAATNSIRETKSEPLLFRVKFAPICKEDQIIVVGASRGESLNISCKVEADPPVRNFRWKFNNSGATLEVSPKQFTIPMSGDADGVSILKYTPVTDVDYGTLSCWADNEVGTQARPCLFQIVTAGKPSPVRNCTLANQTYTSVEVKCIAGYDGGLPQRFVLEVYHGNIDSLPDSKPQYNISSSDEPIFSLSSLDVPVDAGVHVAVYAVNAKGRSQPIILSEVTFRDAEKRTGQDAGIVLSPLIGIVIGALLTLVSVVFAIVVKARRERMSKSRHQKPGELRELPQQQYSNPSPQQTVETDPDVIPNKFEGNLMEVSPPSYPGYSSTHWVTPGPTPSIDELCHKFTGRPTELRLPSRSTIPILPNSTITGVVVGAGQGVFVAGECIDGEAIKRRLMANRLPESCV